MAAFMMAANASKIEAGQVKRQRQSVAWHLHDDGQQRMKTSALMNYCTHVTPRS